MDKLLLEIKKQIREWIRLDYIEPKDIPSIELYMDQITTFMDTHLENNKRSPDDKTLTKTMINNYTKNNLLPPPNKKRYSKEHIILLIYIYYLKNILTINDINSLLQPMIEQYYGSNNTNDAHSMESIYKTIFTLEKEQYFNIEQSIAIAYKTTEKGFPKEESEYLNKCAFICLLSYDIYSKKRLMEQLIDEIASDTTAKDITSKDTIKKTKKETQDN